MQDAPGTPGDHPPDTLLVFDFISHDDMHHAFNEEYLRLLQHAYPRHRIRFHAQQGHLGKLAPKLSDVTAIDYCPCEPFTVPFGLSKHNPIAAWFAARRCLATMKAAVAGRRVSFAALLGMDASLWAAMRNRWQGLSSAPLDMILHSQVGEAMSWRSRNPMIRAFDILSQMQHALPPRVRVAALELGIKESLLEIAPKLAPSIVTLEHPILRGEWSEELPPSDPEVVRIAFLGHARLTKGFHIFVRLAAATSRPDLTFEAIGLASNETEALDQGCLVRRPSPTPLPRENYLTRLHAIDLVCLPLHSRAYDFISSGTLADAVAALKPIIAIRNRSLDAIFARYGAIGWLADGADELFALVRNLNRSEFLRLRPDWITNLRRIREARLPEALARVYPGLKSSDLMPETTSAVGAS